MRIIIIGAGLGGLTAAYVFARNGKHTVTVLERNKDLSPQGSGLNTRPSASRLLHQWDLEADMVAISDSTPTVLLRDLKDGKLAMRSVLLNASAWPDHGKQYSGKSVTVLQSYRYSPTNVTQGPTGSTS